AKREAGAETFALGKVGKIAGGNLDSAAAENLFAPATMPAGPGEQVVLYVATDNPAVTQNQVTDYLKNNGIVWQAEPRPQPLNLKQSQVLEGARYRPTQYQLTKSQAPAIAAAPATPAETTAGQVPAAKGGPVESAGTGLIAGAGASENRAKDQQQVAQSETNGQANSQFRGQQRAST